MSESEYRMWVEEVTPASLAGDVARALDGQCVDNIVLKAVRVGDEVAILAKAIGADETRLFVVSVEDPWPVMREAANHWQLALQRYLSSDLDGMA